MQGRVKELLVSCNVTPRGPLLLATSSWNHGQAVRIRLLFPPNPNCSLTKTALSGWPHPQPEFCLYGSARARHLEQTALVLPTLLAAFPGARPPWEHFRTWMHGGAPWELLKASIFHTSSVCSLLGDSLNRLTSEWPWNRINETLLNSTGAVLICLNGALSDVIRSKQVPQRERSLHWSIFTATTWESRTWSHPSRVLHPWLTRVGEKMDLFYHSVIAVTKAAGRQNSFLGFFFSVLQNHSTSSFQKGGLSWILEREK